MTDTAPVVGERLHELLHRCKQRSGLSYQELDSLAAVCEELTALRQALAQAGEALWYLAQVPILDSASGHDTIGYMRGNMLLSVSHLRPLRSLAALTKLGAP